DEVKGAKQFLEMNLAPKLADKIALFGERFVTGGKEDEIYPYPRWRGESLQGKTLLILLEQGIGDIIMFTGFFPALLHEGATITIVGAKTTYARLQPLMTRAFPQVECIWDAASRSEELLARPFNFYTVIGDVMVHRLPAYEPREVTGYLQADSHLVKQL